MVNRLVSEERLTDYRKKVYELVKRIPAGRVMTYGQIARILGEEYTARTVGFVMKMANLDEVPWHRVINSRGGCSTTRLTFPVNLQQRLLEQEGVQFDDKGYCDIEKYLWEP